MWSSPLAALEATSVDKMGFWAFHSAYRAATQVLDIGLQADYSGWGTAAHAIPPTASQGANQSFEDVRALATLLSKLSPAVPLDKAAQKVAGIPSGAHRQGSGGGFDGSDDRQEAAGDNQGEAAAEAV